MKLGLMIFGQNWEIPVIVIIQKLNIAGSIKLLFYLEFHAGTRKGISNEP
jgi:hypothetical protein